MGIGGAPISLANLIGSLNPERFCATVMTRASNATTLFRAAGAEIEIVKRVPVFRHTTAGGYSLIDPRLYYNWAYASVGGHKWQRIFNQITPDIVHLNSITLLPLCRPAYRSGAKVVVTVRETVRSGNWGLRRQWISRHLSRYAHAVLHISEYDRRVLNCRSEIVRVIPNWVDFDVFDRAIPAEAVRQELGLSPRQRIAVTFGGATPIKGTLVFLKAASMLRDRDDYAFVVVGLSPRPASSLDDVGSSAKRMLKRCLGIDMKDRIHEFCRKHRLDDSVHFLGKRLDIPQILAASSVLVFPAIRPHQARPVLEAGAMAKPVIVSDFECLHEFVGQCENGIRVPPQNPQALQRALVTLLDDPNLASRMGEANYRVALEKHRKERNAPQVVGVYERLLDL